MWVVGVEVPDRPGDRQDVRLGSRGIKKPQNIHRTVKLKKTIHMTLILYPSLQSLHKNQQSLQPSLQSLHVSDFFFEIRRMSKFRMKSNG